VRRWRLLQIFNIRFVHLMLELLCVPGVERNFILEFALSIRLEVAWLVLPEAFGEHFSEERSFLFRVNHPISN